MANWIDAGKVKITPKGDYDATVQYEADDLVLYDDTSYICLVGCKGIAPTSGASNEYWQLIVKKVGVATSTTNGIAKPDNTTIVVDANGTLSVASTSADSITYDNSTSGATATNVQGAIDEAFTDIATKQDKLTDPLTKSDVVDSLTSDVTDVPLSAHQGKVLNDLIATTAGVTDVTSAEYKADKEKYDAMNTFIHITDEANTIDATAVNYNDDTTSLGSTDVQGAIEILANKKSAGVVDVTTATYLADKDTYDAMDSFIRLTDSNTEVEANNVSYDDSSSAIGATTVQSAISTLNNNITRNNFNDAIELTLGNTYRFDSDGYVNVGSGDGAIVFQLRNSTGDKQMTTVLRNSLEQVTIYVKKGMIGLYEIDLGSSQLGSVKYYALTD